MFIGRVLISVLVFAMVVKLSYAQQESTSTPVDPTELADEESKQESDSGAEGVDDTLAQEPEVKPQEPEVKPQVPEEAPGNAKAPRKVFKPTEEISEDSPVPFPVDI